MSGTPELDQVTDARRRVAVHAALPHTYWVLYGAGLIALASAPIWTTWLTPGSGPILSWVLVAVGLASAAFSWIRRRRSGVYLPKRIRAYPSARPIRRIGFAVTAAGFAGTYLLVLKDERMIASLVLAVVVVAVFITQVMTRSAMRRDVEAGRVEP